VSETEIKFLKLRFKSQVACSDSAMRKFLFISIWLLWPYRKDKV